MVWLTILQHGIIAKLTIATKLYLNPPSETNCNPGDTLLISDFIIKVMDEQVEEQEEVSPLVTYNNKDFKITHSVSPKESYIEVQCKKRRQGNNWVF